MIKKCRVCKKHLKQTCFSRDKSRKDGLGNVCKGCSRSRLRAHNLKRKFGISISEYEIMLGRQDSRCAICGSYQNDNLKRRFAVDHNHTTGGLRGLLCVKCNLGIGAFMDSEVILQNAISYLKKHRK